MKHTSAAAAAAGTAQVGLRRELMADSAWALAGRAIMLVGTFVANALLARLLAPEAMGAYFLAFNLATFAAVVAQLGLSQGVIRFAGEALARGEPARARAAIRGVITLAAAGALVVGALVASGIGRWIAQNVFGSAELTAVIRLCGIWVVVLGVQGAIAESFRALRQVRAATFFGGANTAAIAVAFFGLLWFAGETVSLALVLRLSIAAVLLNVAAAALVLGSRLRAIPGADHVFEWRNALRIAWPLLLTNVLLIALVQADVWILAGVAADSEVAVYGAASRLVLLVTAATWPLYAVLPPRISELHTRADYERLQRLLRTGATASALVALPVILALFLAPATILTAVYGEYYAAGDTVLRILSLGLAVNVATGMRGYVLLITGHERAQLAITVASVMLLVVGGTVGAIYAGTTGLAAAAAAAMAAQCLTELAMVRHRLGIWTHSSVAAVPRLFARAAGRSVAP